MEIIFRVALSLNYTGKGTIQNGSVKGESLQKRRAVAQLQPLHWIMHLDLAVRGELVCLIKMQRTRLLLPLLLTIQDR